jgi:hypothetical protein
VAVANFVAILIAWRNWVKSRKSSVGITSFPIEICTEHCVNMQYVLSITTMLICSFYLYRLSHWHSYVVTGGTDDLKDLALVEQNNYDLFSRRGRSYCCIFRTRQRCLMNVVLSLRGPQKLGSFLSCSFFAPWIYIYSLWETYIIKVPIQATVLL